MSLPQIPAPGKLFLSIISSKWESFWPELKADMEQQFGKSDYLSDIIPFTETSYYDRELDTPISRRILTFEPLCNLDSLVNIKLATNALENRFKKETKRLFNLDPGLVTLERLVLATGKNFTHRIYLSQGIWADLTLVFTKGDWKDLAWTFPDYSSEKIKKHLRIIRTRYQGQLSHQNTHRK